MTNTEKKELILRHRKRCLKARNMASLHNEFCIRDSAEKELSFWNTKLSEINQPTTENH